METCKICNREFSSIKGLANHIKYHDIVKEQYYLLYIKPNDIGTNKCKNCQKETKFRGLNSGYAPFCSIHCSETFAAVTGLKNPRKGITEESIEKMKISRASEESLIKYKNTCLERYGVEYYGNIEKRKQTSLDHYGVDNPAKSEEVKNKIKETSINNGYQVSDEQKAEYLLYSHKVSKLTRKNKKILFEFWDGYDYYDGEYIKDNFNLLPGDRNYPTIDHKISILDGFLNNIYYEVIASIDNLCITKKWINSSKYSKGDYHDYKN